MEIQLPEIGCRSFLLRWWRAFLPPSPVDLYTQVKTTEPDCNLLRNVGEALLIGNAPCLRSIESSNRTFIWRIKTIWIWTDNISTDYKEIVSNSWVWVCVTDGREREREIVCVRAYVRVRAHAHPTFRLVSCEVHEKFYWYKKHKNLMKFFIVLFQRQREERWKGVGEMRIL
jgi:hypothetical protein